MHKKTGRLGIDDRIYTMAAFLEKVAAANLSLVEYIVPLVTKEYFGNIDSGMSWR